MTTLKILRSQILPSGWEEVSLGILRQNFVARSFNPEKHRDVTFELYSVPSHETSHPEIVSGSSIGSNKQYVDIGDVLISKINPRLNRVWVVGDFSSHPKIASTEWIVFTRSEVVDSAFLSYILQSLPIRDYLAHNASGVGGSLTRVRPALLDSVFIGLPSFNEQKRIVAKIEELFSELDKGIESLKTAREQLKVYRQALLKHAFEGKLTAQWREENKDKLETADALLKRIQTERYQRYQQQLKEWQKALKKWEAGGKKDKKPAKPSQPKHLPPLTPEELADLPQLPEGWAWSRLDEIALAITDGDHQAPPQTSQGVPFITISDIKGHRIDFSDTRYVSKSYFDNLSVLRKPILGDILYTVTGSFGIPCLIDFVRDFCFQRHIALIRSCKSISKRFLFYALASHHVYAQAVAVATGTAQKTVPLGGLRLFTVPLPSQAEQQQIANELDSRFSVADQLAQTIEQALQQSEALRQSILKKAFSGQLVPQDPNDEPAAVLLERIRAEREKETKKVGPKTARRGKACPRSILNR